MVNCYIAIIFYYSNEKVVGIGKIKEEEELGGIGREGDSFGG